MSYEFLIGLAPLTTLIASFALPAVHYIVRGNQRVVQALALIASAIPLIISFKLVELAYTSDRVYMYKFGGWPPPIGITYMLDKVNSLLVLFTALLMFLIVVYSYDYLKEHGGLSWYYTLYFGLETGILGVLLTGDVFNLFVMIEVVSVSAYSLVMFYRHSGEAVAAGLKYAFIGSLGTIMYFLALGVIYGVFGTLNLFDLTCKVHGQSYPVTGSPIGDVFLGTAIALVLASWAFSIKAGVFPNHFWLPDAHPAAPTPVSALLSGLVVNVGAYAMFRYIYIIYGGELDPSLKLVLDTVSTLLLFMGTISTFIGSLLMHIQIDVKRIIAYSTVMHMGYLFMAISARSAMGSAAFTLHMINHSVAKATLFLAAGAFIYATGSRKLENYGGLAQSLPLPTLAMAVAGLNLAGVPPLPIFYSKLMLFNALLQLNIAYAITVVVTSVIAFLAYIRLLYVALLGRRVVSKVRKIPMSFNIVLATLTVLMLLMSIGIEYIVTNLVDPAALQTMSVSNYMIKP